MRFVCSLAFAVLCTASPVLAEGYDTNPLHYTAVGHKNKPADGQIKLKTINHDAPALEEEKTETSAQKVWNRYKALATGIAAEEEEKSSKEERPKDEQKPAETDAEEAENPPSSASPTGIAGLIQEYQKNRVMRSQMHTIIVRPSEEEKAKKPEG